MAKNITTIFPNGDMVEEPFLGNPVIGLSEQKGADLLMSVSVVASISSLSSGVDECKLCLGCSHCVCEKNK